MLRTLPLVVALLAATALAQTPEPAPPPHTQVNPDGSITFRLNATSGNIVEVDLDRYTKPLALSRGADGVWSVTTPVLEPEYYNYSFSVDGVKQLDPYNNNTRFNYVSLGNWLLVPGTAPMPWELTDIAHGQVDHHLYTTHIVQHLPENQSAYTVYLPPHYDPHRKGGYPVLYLLHGWSDNDTGWTEVGRANRILDTLIDSGKAVPMIVVMPLGYGNLDFVDHGFSVWQDPAKVTNNLQLFSEALFHEVIPAVEGEYNVAKGRENRAIAGLSMGGQEALYIGLNHSDQFAWIGGMSAAVHDRQYDTDMAGLDASKTNLRLLWVGCGKQDGLFPANQAFIAWARGKGLTVTAVETPLAHVWLTWRENLLQLAPLLFQPK